MDDKYIALNNEAMKLYKRTLFLTRYMPNKMFLLVMSFAVFIFCEQLFKEEFLLYLCVQLGIFALLLVHTLYMPSLINRCQRLERQINP